MVIVCVMSAVYGVVLLLSRVGVLLCCIDNGYVVRYVLFCALGVLRVWLVRWLWFVLCPMFFACGVVLLLLVFCCLV